MFPDPSFDPDTWLDSDDDPPYETESSLSSDTEDEQTTSLTQNRQRKSRIIPTAEVLYEEVEPIMEDEQSEVNTGRPITSPKKRKKRISVKGRARDIREGRKEKRNTGREYTTESGKLIRAKKWSALDNCKKKCKERIAEEDARKLFHELWSIGDYSKRMSYLASLITSHEKHSANKKVEDTSKQKNRMVTNVYNLRINGALVPVCKGCFRRNFDVTNKALEIINNKSKLNTSGIVEGDGRGKGTAPNKTSDDVIQAAKNHILSIPAYESHYSRRHTSKKYIPSHYTLSGLYKEYKSCTTTKPISRTLYSKIFHDLGLAIKPPKNDTCYTCDKLSMEISLSEGEKKTALEKILADHHDSADNAYKSKDLDKKAASLDSSIKTLTFDLQQCLPTPLLESSVVFYKRQLWTFNLTVHDSTDNQAYCYMWCEADAGRGSNQIASCMYKHLTNIFPETKNVVMYSDTCGGQNKNSTMLGMCMTLVKNHETLQHIDHKFLVPGHTHMECDADHALIEKTKKKRKLPIYHPHDWMQLVRQTGEKKKFHVTSMSQQDFFQFSSLFETPKGKNCPLKMPSKNGKIFHDNGERFLWKNVRWLRFIKDSPRVLYKESLNIDVPFKSISIMKRGHGQNRLIPSLTYSGKVPITIQKKKDLLSLLPLIPSVFHDFYKNLETKKGPDVLPEDGEQEEDEEVEDPKKQKDTEK